MNRKNVNGFQFWKRLKTGRFCIFPNWKPFWKICTSLYWKSLLMCRILKICLGSIQVSLIMDERLVPTPIYTYTTHRAKFCSDVPHCKRSDSLKSVSQMGDEISKQKCLLKIWQDLYRWSIILKKVSLEKVTKRQLFALD